MRATCPGQKQYSGKASWISIELLYYNYIIGKLCNALYNNTLKCCCCCCCCRYSLSAVCTAFVRGAPQLGWYLPSLPKGAHLQGDLWVSGLVLWPRCYTKVVRTLSHHHPECICSQSLKPSSNTSLPDAWDYSARQIRQLYVCTGL